MDLLPSHFGLRFSATRWWANWGFRRIPEHCALGCYQWALSLGPFSLFRFRGTK